MIFFFLLLRGHRVTPPFCMFHAGYVGYYSVLGADALFGSRNSRCWSIAGGRETAKSCPTSRPRRGGVEAVMNSVRMGSLAAASRIAGRCENTRRTIFCHFRADLYMSANLKEHPAHRHTV